MTENISLMHKFVFLLSGILLLIFLHKRHRRKGLLSRNLSSEVDNVSIKSGITQTSTSCASHGPTPARILELKVLQGPKVNGEAAWCKNPPNVAGNICLSFTNYLAPISVIEHLKIV